MNLLDTNVCVEMLRGRPSRILKRINAAGVGQVLVSSITAAELFTGALKSSRVSESMAATHLLLSGLTVVSFDIDAARAYGLLRSFLEQGGRKIGNLDTLIAAHALAIGATMVTNNTREFARVPGLIVEDWLI